MESTLNIVWGLFENLILVVLTCYFFYKQLESAEGRRYRILIGGAGILAVMILCKASDAVQRSSLFFMLLANILCAVLAFRGSLSKRILVGCIPITLIYTTLLMMSLAFALWNDVYIIDIFSLPSQFRYAVFYLSVVAVTLWLMANRLRLDVYFPVIVSAAIIFICVVGLFALTSIININLFFTFYEQDSPVRLDFLFAASATAGMLICNFVFMVFIGNLYSRYLSEHLRKQKESYDERYVLQIERSTTFLRQQKHDFLGHIKTMSVLIDANKIADLKRYFSELSGEYRQEPLIILTANTTFNAVITSKMIEARSLGIPFEANIHLFNAMPMSGIQITTLMVNIIDNAINACQKVADPEKRFIKLAIKDAADLDMIMIEARNSSNGAYRLKYGALLTTNISEGRGLGMAKIKSLVEEAGGFVEIRPQEREFTITIMLPAGGRVTEAPNDSYFDC